MDKRLLSLVAVIAGSVSIAACGATAVAPHTTASRTTSSRSQGAARALKPVSGHATVVIRDFMYHPMLLKVTAGTKVTFRNEDQTAHTATAINGSFSTGTVKPGASATVVLRHPGSDRYHCLFHAFMVARIIVVKKHGGA